MIIDCVADLHGEFPKLDGGDLLIIAGDLTASDLKDQYIHFCSQIRHAGYKKIIVIAGNHDNLMQNEPQFFLSNDHVSYLCDSGTEFEYDEIINHPASTEHVSIDVLMSQKRKLKIWGSPWTKTFPGMNPHCKAFTCDTDEELAEKWALIPDDIDILITHSPSFGNLDCNYKKESYGSVSLWMMCLLIKPKLHIFGHVHEGYGQFKHCNGIHLVNASIMNGDYEPVNKPIRIIL